MSELEVDLIQPVIAFRAWVPMPYGDKLVLGSTGIAGAWAPGVNTARCLRVGGPCPVVPAPDKEGMGCKCGFNTWFSVDKAKETGPIIGAVVVHGRIEVHPDGMRAEHARVVALSTDNVPWDLTFGKKLIAHYGVPLVSFEELPAAAEAEGIYLPEEYKPCYAEWLDEGIGPAAIGGAVSTATSQQVQPGTAVITGGTITLTSTPLVLPPGSTLSGAHITSTMSNAPVVVEKPVNARWLSAAAYVAGAGALLALIGGIAHGIA